MLERGKKGKRKPESERPYRFPYSPFPISPSSPPLSFLLPFAAALQFLTLAPPIVRRSFTPAELGRAVGFFPLVGFLLGGGLSLTAWGLGHFFPPGVTAALVLVAWVGLTGALHLDGFLDTCDGLFGGHDPETRLHILRDERVGAYAVAGGVLLLLVKYAALAAIVESTGRQLAVSLLLSPVMGRWGISLAIVAFPYARQQGLGRAMKDHAGRRQALLAGATALGIALAVAGGTGVLIWLLATGATWLLARFAQQRLPGLTGDLYGAMCEVVEVLVLLEVVNI